MSELDGELTPDRYVWCARCVCVCELQLKHTGPGILSMANAGKNSQKRETTKQRTQRGRRNRRRCLSGFLIHYSVICVF